GVAMAAQHEDAKVIEVQMLNQNPDDRSQRMVFYPDLVRANVGDTIRFVSTDKGHNSESSKDMLPEGAEGWKGPISQDLEVTLTQDGTYGYHCTPHATLGMVGLILVGDAMVNFQAARDVRQRGRAADRYEDIFARAEAMLAEEKPA
ncbi:MAG TPA: pseudoazurin, partial [Paracoccaceae bacterium]|nr:pseudoazurin [Paracoccaceae bacterium]